MTKKITESPKKEIARIIVELYKEFSNALIEAEKKGRGHYSD